MTNSLMAFVCFIFHAGIAFGWWSWGTQLVSEGAWTCAMAFLAAGLTMSYVYDRTKT